MMWDSVHGSGMMGYWGGWMAPFGVIVWVFVLALIIAGIVWLVRALTQRSSETGRRSSALDVLEERYVRGEINRDEYLEKKRDIG